MTAGAGDPDSRYVSQRPPASDPWVKMSQMRPLFAVELPGEVIAPVPQAVAEFIAGHLQSGGAVPGVVRALVSYGSPWGTLYRMDND